MIGTAMNRPVMEGLRLNTPAYVRHSRLVEWVAEMAALTEAGVRVVKSPADMGQALEDALRA